ncbi:hypothetical protein, partial [Alkanindiges illinoisensis]|uniref:hypothetical protein n=1 Tax=Alkanindiges illinoisensis TaxID=197183 RepID=UPI00196A7935
FKSMIIYHRQEPVKIHTSCSLQSFNESIHQSLGKFTTPRQCCIVQVGHSTHFKPLVNRFFYPVLTGQCNPLKSFKKQPQSTQPKTNHFT